MKIISRKAKGISAAIGVTFFQSFESVLLPLFGIIFTTVITKTPAFAGAIMAIKEFFSLIFMLLCSSPYIIKSIWKKIKSKQGFYFIVAATIGTTFGNMFFILAVTYAGSGYGVILTSLYPIITIVLINWIFKEKESWKVWFGVILTVISAILFIMLPVIISNEKMNWQKILGIIFGAVAALFWAIEGLFINRGIRGPIVFSNREIMTTRSLLTAFMSIILVLPITSSFGELSFIRVVDIFENWKSINLILVIALNIFVLRLTSIYAIRQVGPKITSVIDTSNFILPAIIIEFLSFIPGSIGEMYKSANIIWWTYFLIIPIIFGVFIAVFFQKISKEKELNFEPK